MYAFYSGPVPCAAALIRPCADRSGLSCSTAPDRLPNRLAASRPSLETFSASQRSKAPRRSSAYASFIIRPQADSLLLKSILALNLASRSRFPCPAFLNPRDAHPWPTSTTKFPMFFLPCRFGVQHEVHVPFANVCALCFVVTQGT